MKTCFSGGLILVACLMVGLTSANGQELIITNGLRIISGLTNVSVLLTGKCELRITGSSNPIPGCTINLASPDSFLAFTSIRPSVVRTTLLTQVRVGGALAIPGTNIRLAQYGMGTILLPHSNGFAPLEVYTGPNFTGISTNLRPNVYYTNTLLGAWNCNIRSFRLKRGYMVTLAQNFDGSGYSVVFVAQEDDLEVGVLPEPLWGSCSFVRVIPWRWVSKKGWAGDLQTKVAPYWFYDWDNTDNSTIDVEYVPMRWGRWWNSYDNINSKQDVTHVLGFNEPDKSDQANMTVMDAIAEWPNLMKSGLRVGSPAVSDSATAGMGLDWLYSFMDQADALGYRVDFVTIHFYKCDWSATQLSNYLWGIYRRTRRPIWVTEFNNGANWCSSTPTYEQNANVISNFLNVLEGAPFVERYAIYNWVGTNRALVLDDGTLTPAGIVYRDRISLPGYSQTYPSGFGRGLAQLSFEGDLRDRSGFGNNALAVGYPQFVTGKVGFGVSLDGSNTWLQLPALIAKSNGFTFAAWVYWRGGPIWQRIFDFGNDTVEYMFLTPNSGAGTLRFAITTNGYGSEQKIEIGGFSSNRWYHVVVTVSNNVVRLYTNGVLCSASSTFTITPANVKPTRNYIGKSQFMADPLFNGIIDEVLVLDYALSPAQVAALLSNQPPRFTVRYLELPPATHLQPYSNSVAGLAFDPDPNDTLSYFKAMGPSWVQVSSDGTVTGTPMMWDSGTNYLVVRVEDKAGLSDYMVALLPLPVTVRDSRWVVDKDGAWSDTTNWENGFPANGFGKTADFSTVNITQNRTVVVDYPIAIGILKFGDLVGSQSWTLVGTNRNTFTLGTGTSAKPTVIVTNTVTLAVTIEGTNGFAKSGPGTLILAASNCLSGEVDIDNGRTSGSDGVVRFAYPGSVGAINRIRIRNNNDGVSTLQLDGVSGPVVVGAELRVNCRNQATPILQNLSGTNRITGPIYLDVGGNRFNIQSDSGLLEIAGLSQYIGSLTGARSYVFSGGGDHLVTGPILNSTNGAPIGLYKTGSGTLTLAATNTFTGPISNMAGILRINGRVSSSNTFILGGILSGRGRIDGSVWIGPSGRLAPGNEEIGALEVRGALTNLGTWIVRVSKSSGTLKNDTVQFATNVVFGGYLIVSNVSQEILTAGDRLRIAIASRYSGQFAGIVPQIPGAGLVWDTSQLVVDGSILVRLGVLTPKFTLVDFARDELVFGGIGGAAGYKFTILASTNLSLPLDKWEPIATNLFDAEGKFEVRIPRDSITQFFTIKVEY